MTDEVEDVALTPREYVASDSLQETEKNAAALVPSPRNPRREPDKDAKRVAFLIYGTRGDVQPFVALCDGLQRTGRYQILFVTNENHGSFLDEFGVDSKCTLSNMEKDLQDEEMRDFMATGDFWAWMKASKLLNRKDRDAERFTRHLDLEYDALKEFKPDFLVISALQMHIGALLGHVLQVPVIKGCLQPLKPSRHLKTVLNEPCFSYTCWMKLLKSLYVSFMKNDFPICEAKFRKEMDGGCLWPTFEDYMHEVMNPLAPEVLAWSPAFGARPKDWPKSLDCVTTCGFWIVGKQEQMRLSGQRNSTIFGSDNETLNEFLKAGAPPVYLGWGSMTPASPESMVGLAIRSLKKTGLRGIVLSGWAKLKGEMLDGQPDAKELQDYIKSHVLFVDSAPHEWLFPQCAVLVHHGGAGTIAAALRSGRPQVITPCFLDQFLTAQLINRTGCGIGLKQFNKNSVKTMSEAIKKCVAKEAIKKKAEEVGEILLAEDGVGKAVQVIDEFVKGDMVSGVWRAKFDEAVKRSKGEVTAVRKTGCCSRHQSAPHKVHPQK